MNKKIQQWALKLSGYQCKIEYQAGKDNTGLLSRIPEKLESECVRLEPGVDNRAYQENVTNSHTLSKHPVWEAKDEEEVVRDPHWEVIMENNQDDSEISSLRSEVEAGTTSSMSYIMGCWTISRTREGKKSKNSSTKNIKTRNLRLLSWKVDTHGDW